VFDFSIVWVFGILVTNFLIDSEFFKSSKLESESESTFVTIVLIAVETFVEMFEDEKSSFRETIVDGKFFSGSDSSLRTIIDWLYLLNSVFVRLYILVI